MSGTLTAGAGAAPAGKAAAGAPAAAPGDPKWPAGAPLAAGIVAALLLGGGFGVWSVTTRLAGAVVAPGQVEVLSNRQVIEHPDGGVVGEILVKDGDRVAAGQVLLRLDGTRTRSELAIVTGQLKDLAARRARLEAERDGLDSVTFSPQVQAWAAEDPAFAAEVASERTLFRARLQALQQQTDLLSQQNSQIANRILGTQAQLDAVQEQVKLVSAALADQKTLLAQGLAQAARVLDLERELANQQGQAGQLGAQIAELKGETTANEISVLQLTTKRREEAVTQLRDIEAKQVQLAEQQLALNDTLSRLDIRAPVSGIVYGSKVFALHSVVRPADPLMYIIPQDQPLVVAARVAATHVDDIHPDQPVSLSFPSFDQHLTLPITGHIEKISADVMTDETTHQSYYAVTVVPDPDALAALGADRKLVPGMPVEAFIQTGSRSALSYLMHPLTVYFGRAFRN
jgi:HlyD family secretion protein